MNKKNIFFTIILLTAFSIASILVLLTVKEMTTVHESTNNSPDFFMINTACIKFDQNGTISNQFYTSKISHFATNNNFFFDNPHIRMYNANEQPWDVTANKGKSEQGKSKIYLWSNVRVIQATIPNNPDFDITTNALTICPDIKFAETNEPLTIIQSGSIAKAIGAQADFKAGIVKLLANVEGLYQTK